MPTSSRPRPAFRACLALLLGICLAEAGARLEARAASWFRRPPAGAFELYVVGESTPAGVPFGRERAFPVLAVRAVGGRLAGRPVTLISLARGGESIYPQAYAFERALAGRRANPGAVVIYAGNNDADSVPGAGRFERSRERLLERSVLLRDLYFLAERDGIIRHVRTRENYAYHLRRVLELSRAAGLTAILFTVPSNLTGVDPGLFSDYKVPSPPPPSREEYSAVLRRGRAEEAGGRFDAAIRLYREAAGAWPAFKPYAAYLTAGCLARSGRLVEARRFYELARDTAPPDSFGRAAAWQNALIRRLAAEFRAPLVDAAALFERRAPAGLPGSELFGDAHHPNLAGVALLADALARELARFGAAVDPDGAAGRLALAADRATRVKGLVYSGRWLFTVACRHLHPDVRLDLAARRFRSALALSPDEFSAWLGLCLVEAGRRRPSLLVAPEETDWLGRRALLYGDRFELSPEDFAEVAAKLRAAGVPPELLRRAEESFQRERSTRTTVRGRA